MTLIEGPVSEEVLALIRTHFSKVKIASTHDQVFKDECMFSFDTPFSPNGLYVSLCNLQGFGQDYLKLAVERGAGPLYLHQVWKRVPKAPASADVTTNMDISPDVGAAKHEPTVLALGVDGGFRTDEQKWDIIRTHRLIVLKPGGTDGFSVGYPDEALPTILTQAADAVIEHQGAAEQVEVHEWVAENRLMLTRYADDLLHVDTDRKVSMDPKAWICEDSGTTENLWLNLSTGYIGSGRQNWDGSGGTGAALRHYEQTGSKYPLAVKLGTITPHGADVYSYAPDEDNLVKDPKLPEHLARWGIDIMQLERTDKTMAELEVELNKSYDFHKITEAGANLKPLAGSGYTGIKNLGNSCYMNSCLQILCSLPEVGERYNSCATQIYRSAPEDIAFDFPAQMSKVAGGLLSGNYSHMPPPSADDGQQTKSSDGENVDGVEEPVEILVAPRMFKHLVGRGHPEFSSGRQQDAAEYMLHLLECMRRSEHTNAGRLSAISSQGIFQFKTVHRLQCMQSGTVKYITRAPDNMLNLQIPVEASVNQQDVEAYQARLKKRQRCQGCPGTRNIKEEEEEEVKPVIPLSACLSKFGGEETLSDYRSAVTGKRGQATTRLRIANFPKYLLVKLCRYYVDTDWHPKKLDVEVDVPLTIDLESLRSTGIQEDEVPMPDTSSATPDGNKGKESAALVPDEDLVSQLLALGYNENGCRRAAVAVENASAELAVTWILEHAEDSDFNDPLPMTSMSSSASPVDRVSQPAAPEVVAMLASLGFTERQAKGALNATGGDATRSADWLFSHVDNLDAAVEEQLEPKRAATKAGGPRENAGNEALNDGPGRYTLIGFISHVGKNTGCGHYVAHLKKDGRWAIFDDQKVAESENPPLSLGYLYLFKRNDSPTEVSATEGCPAVST